MEFEFLNSRDFISECKFATARSSGPGGQNVNKVNSKVELRFNISESKLLTEQEKANLQSKFLKKISADGFLIITSQVFSSQLKNKETAILKFNKLLNNALKPEKIRKKVKLSKADKENRLKNKKVVSDKKSLRKKITDIF
ncbi:MAG: hypothetical protein A2046_08575 [Bacteroidetes bacterium GWA2_30_7]|nr:MAG: hypothetical protein A2046_08575 [Bacteroidetes bacterium GWA2_30_7]